MPEIGDILEALKQIRQQVDEIEGALGRLHAQAEIEAVPSLAPRPAVVPPTAPPIEIMGGEVTDQFPDCCAVGNDLGYYCSGTLIAPNVVVTADHCQQVTRVFLGGNNVDEPEHGQVVRVAAQYSHPDVDLKALLLDTDVRAIIPRHVAQGADIAVAREKDGCKIATVAGFGTIDAQGSVGYGRKRYVEVPILSLDGSEVGCAKKYGCRPGLEMVAGHRGLLLDTCSGDSGGPLYIQNDKGDYYLLGATSRGSRDSLSVCGDGGLYVRVDLCLDWIRQVTGADI